MIDCETEDMVTKYQEMRGIEETEDDEILAGISASIVGELRKK
jgi:hypothetical protein